MLVVPGGVPTLAVVVRGGTLTMVVIDNDGTPVVHGIGHGVPLKVRAMPCTDMDYNNNYSHVNHAKGHENLFYSPS